MVSMDADKVVTATFFATPPSYYTLTMGLIGNGVITPTAGAHSYLAGTVVDLSASPAAGWQFAGWSGAVVTTTNPLVLTMDAVKSVTATFITH
jgi:Divergent InlB B-repeat domain